MTNNFNRCWCIIYPYDIPKKVEIIKLYEKINVKFLKVQYKNRIFEVRIENSFYMRDEAYIFWILEMIEHYKHYKNNVDLYNTDEIEIGYNKAKKCFSKLMKNKPELVLKYF